MAIVIDFTSDAGDTLSVLTSLRETKEFEEITEQLWLQFQWVPIEQVALWLGMCDDPFIVRLACMAVTAEGSLRWADPIVWRGMQ
jgi:hypothetical protein